VALDRLLYDRINELRLWEGFPEIASLPRQFPFAASLNLGVFDPELIRIQQVKIAREIGRASIRCRSQNNWDRL